MEFLVPDVPYNFLKARGDPPTGTRPRRITPSMSNAIPNEDLQCNQTSPFSYFYNFPTVSRKPNRELDITVRVRA